MEMFEVLSMLCLICRTDINRRLEILFEVFCFNGEIYMQKGEFRFMINKLCIAFASTI
jgi:hypothetical protein